VLGGAAFRDTGEKVMRNVLDLEAIQVELPTVAKTTKGQGQLVNFRVSECVHV
jgi:hypothetical protein